MGAKVTSDGPVCFECGGEIAWDKERKDADTVIFTPECPEHK